MHTIPFNLIAEVQDKSFWFPTDAASSNQVDGLSYFILAICGFFLFFNAGLMVFFAMRYRQQKKEGAAHGQTHNTALEITWSVIPAFILAIIFYWGFRGYLHQSTPPDDAYDIHVTGYKWGWNFTYPDGHSAKAWKRPGEDLGDPVALHVPAEVPVRLTLESKDVIHSVFIKQMRVKKDCVPGRFNQMWFEAHWDPDKVKTRKMPTEDGGTIELEYNEYDLFCTEYCGTKHSQMITKVYVYKNMDEFKKWLEADKLTDPKTPLWEIGQNVWSAQCRSCHSVDGKRGTGPAWNNLIGNPNHKTNKGEINADADYIRESIMDPNAVYADRFNGGMNAFKDLKPREILGLIEFMKTISPDHYPDYEKEKSPTWGDFKPDGTPAADPAAGDDKKADGTTADDKKTDDKKDNPDDNAGD